MYAVVESTPGYLPDTTPMQFEQYSDAVDYAKELAMELEEQGYTCDYSWASRDNYYAIKCTRGDTVAPDLGRVIEVVY